MPCRVELTPDEERRMREAHNEGAMIDLRARLDELTYENDLYRELLLKLVNDGGAPVRDAIPRQILQTITEKQIVHRQEDLRRLDTTLSEKIKTFASTGEMSVSRMDAIADFMNKLKSVRLADATKPLEPQLGFDPDAY